MGMEIKTLNDQAIPNSILTLISHKGHISPFIATYAGGEEFSTSPKSQRKNVTPEEYSTEKCKNGTNTIFSNEKSQMLSLQMV